MKLEKKYGLFTAIGMVVGIVIGSGVFFKAQSVLDKTGGNVSLGILAWIIGGIVIVSCACTFAIIATKYERVNGLVDYSEAIVGKKYAYFIGWFAATIYYPTLTSVLSWLCARYTGELLGPGWELTSNNVMVLGYVFMIATFALNAVAPRLAGKYQVSTTFIKLIPLILMAVVGIVYGLVKTQVHFEVVNGEVVNTGTNQMQILLENFSVKSKGGAAVLFGAVVSTAFAYDGWIVATSINAELKDAKKNLPLALFLGSIIIIVIYILYYLGVAGGATVDVLIKGGAGFAFKEIFGNFVGTILTVFIVVSCMGTLNGLMIASARGFYSIAERNHGPKPEVLKQIDPKTNVPTNSAVFGLLTASIWYAFFFGANLSGQNWFGIFAFDSSELPIVTVYSMYIPIFFMMIVKERKNFGVFKGIILPIIAIVSCIFMIIAAVISHKLDVVFYLIVFAVIMICGMFFYRKKEANEETIKIE